MTRIAAGLGRLASRGQSEPDRRWFCVTAEGLEVGEPWVIDYTPTLSRGGTVWAMRFQARPLDVAELLRVDVQVAVVSSTPVNLAQLNGAEKVVEFGTVANFRVWRSYGENVDEVWNMRRTIAGANQRIAIGIGSNMQGGADIRASVCYSEG